MTNHAAITQPVVSHHDEHTFAIDTRTFTGGDGGDFTVTVAEMPADNDVHRNHNRVSFARTTAAGRNASHDLCVHNVTKVETKRDDESGNTHITVRTAQGETVYITLFDNKS
jgi:hypothetical protein